jgi:hypothetical protein
MLRPALAGFTFALAAGVSAGPGPNSAIIPSTGQTLSIQLTAPADGSAIPLPPGTATIQGQASVGELAGTPTNLLYAVDVSGSTAFYDRLDCDGDGLPGTTSDDVNGAIPIGDVLDCEIQGVLSLNESLFGSVGVSAGLITFARTAAAADIDPSRSGDQTFTGPPDADLNANGIADIAEVARSQRNGRTATPLSTGYGVELFAPKAVENGTDFAPPLTLIRDAFRSRAGQRNIAYLLSDGTQTVTANLPVVDSLASELARAGVQVNTYSIGPSGSGCDANAADPTRAQLARIAAITGGTCTDVQDPSDLGATLAGAFPAGLDRVEVDGRAVPVNAVGEFSVGFTCPGDGQQVGITAVAFADDTDPVTGAQTSVAADLALVCGDAGNGPPQAAAGPDQTLECATPDGADATLDGSGSSDPDGDALDFLWSSAVFGTASGVSVTRTFPLGSSQVTLTVSDDGGESDSDTLLVTVRDTVAPSLTAPPDLVLDCAAPGGTAVDIGTALVADACDAAPLVTNDAPDLFGPGNTLVTWTATDAAGSTASAVQTVSIADATPPAVEVSASPATLWPPNHALVPVTLEAIAEDACDAAATCRIVGVSSNESGGDGCAEHGRGDKPRDHRDHDQDCAKDGHRRRGRGHHGPDWIIDGDLSLRLRAERDGHGSGRDYVIEVACEDSAGNVGTGTATVSVAHDRGHRGGKPFRHGQ